MSLPMPRNLSTPGSEGRRAWTATLPATVRWLQERWSLELGDPYQPGGQTAWVAPARRGGDDLVLKVAWRHPEAAHEADGLRVWDGDGTVRLHAVEHLTDTTAMLLERCEPGDALAGRPEPEQDTVIASMLRRLWRPPGAGHPFRSLQAMCDEWSDEFDVTPRARRPPLDLGLERAGIALFRSLPASAPSEVLLCTDLHAENVLAAQREPWLVIDPKPHVGDPTYDPLQHLLSCRERLHEDPEGLVHRMADLLDLDRERLRLWLFARCVQGSPTWPDLVDVARRVAPA